MKKSHLAWLLGGALLVGSGGLMIACSSSDNTGNPSTGGGTDSGTGGHDGSTSGSDSGTGGQDSGGSSDAGTGSECGTTPALHPSDAGSIYCPFGPDGGAITCQNEACCISGKVGSAFPPSTCAMAGQCNFQADAGNTEIDCEQSADCPSGQVCCGGGPAPQQVQGCGYYQEKGMQYAKCAASCQAAEWQICSSNADCTGGKTCTPTKIKGAGIGFCM